MNIGKIRSEFAARFGGEPRMFRAPGRVNLIGEHTDYNDGFVMPFAIDRESVVAASASGDRRVEAVALDLEETATFELDAPPRKRRGNWIDYVEGTVRCVEEAFGRLPGARLVISSNVPIGSGLSSSAAIEISIGLALLSVSDLEIDREKLAFAAQRAEHEYAGTRSGIMDQFASAFSSAGNAMLLDCRSLDRTPVAFESEETLTAVCDTGVKHELASSEYNKRREECEEGVRLLQQHLPEIKALRDVKIEQLEDFKAQLPDVIYRRCCHVVTENTRTLQAPEHFRAGRSEEAGKLMYASHASLRDDYEVSCEELDALVDIAAKIDGVFGARMTGGGFGGCTVNILRREAFDEFAARIRSGYGERYGRQPEIYMFRAVEGASEVTG
jgi:galactokinase